MIGPLPFRLPAPGVDEIEGLEVRSIAVRIDGLARFEAGVLTLEWAETQHIDEVSIQRVRSDVVTKPALVVDIPMDVIATVSLGGWWRPTIELRARYLEAFVEIPGSKPGRLVLKVPRKHRVMARELVAAVQAAIVDAELALPDEPPGLEP